MEEYRDTRVHIAMTSTLSSGNFFYEGMVQNISRTGIKISDLPHVFDLCSGECSTIVAGNGKKFKLTLQPCWFRDEGMYKEVGFRIVSPSIDWVLFLDELDPRTKDVWGSSF